MQMNNAAELVGVLGGSEDIVCAVLKVGESAKG